MVSKSEIEGVRDDVDLFLWCFFQRAPLKFEGVWGELGIELDEFELGEIDRWSLISGVATLFPSVLIHFDLFIFQKKLRKKKKERE